MLHRRDPEAGVVNGVDDQPSGGPIHDHLMLVVRGVDEHGPLFRGLAVAY
jgi:hypothetical protein